ncbi:Matrix remodeling-associated protein 8 [Galemys pyrenaicus]|uniref:Matrix remodeling-associated protein 8 n=1 Tax=Galemys pyrenaicus TaxID=202257 RepID=A0A8J5ZQE5_GALPY|nr:Matrix remodeling-associated protein 8 [Galemys pyrenaicus]
MGPCSSTALLWRLVLLQSSAVLLSSGPSWLGSPGSSVVPEVSVSRAAGSPAVLLCQSPRMVWTQDRLPDRQRVVHWDRSGGPAGGPAHRLLDMDSAGEQRLYAERDSGRLLLAPSAFHDGNFSLFISEVKETDAGLYTCNLHHHYCQLHETLAIRLDVTSDPRAAGAHWDGEKTVLVAARSAPALLPCVRREHVWTERHTEEAQQVAHWDWQPPGVPHDRADRLLDLYASGERRSYGPPPLRQRVGVAEDAFARGDFSLRIDPLEPADEGTYSCHLHHHYCGLHERRVVHLRVTRPNVPPPPPPPPPPRDAPGNGSGQGSSPGLDPTLVRGHSVINLIVPEGRAHFFQQLGYVLATLLLFILLLITVVLATRQRQRPGYEECGRLKPGMNPGMKPGKPARQDLSMAELAVATGDQPLHRSEDIQLDYKNNILKERAALAHGPPPAKNLDWDRGTSRRALLPSGPSRGLDRALPGKGGGQRPVQRAQGREVCGQCGGGREGSAVLL